MKPKKSNFNPHRTAGLLFFAFSVFAHINTLKAQTDSCRKEIRIGRIDILGNKQTKEKIILRELTFHSGEIICLKNLDASVKQSKINLLKTPLFNFVTIETDIRDSLYADITIKVEERWYFWPVARIGYADPNFSAWLKTKDLTRLNISAGVEKYNARGANEHAILRGVWGYERSIAFAYSNVYIDRKRQNALSFDIKNYNQKSLEYTIRNNRLQEVKLEDRYAFTSIGGSIGLRLRKKIDISHNINFSWERSAIADTILKLNPDFFNGKTTNEFFEIDYSFRFDKRDSRAYPLKGILLTVGAKKIGFDLIKNSDVNIWGIKFKTAKYTPLTAGFYVSNNLEISNTFGRKQSFYMQEALGYGTNLRGYEYYIIKGQDFAVLNNSLKYELISQKIIKLNFLPLKKFNKIHYALYWEFYFDSGYVVNQTDKNTLNNTFENTFLYSYGVGINFVTYYDLLIRLEYSINKIGDRGFFIHFETPF